MPRETIKPATGRFAPVVCWTRNVGVQVGTVDQLDLTQDDGTLNGPFADLDRHSLNRLIEMLRRARNQAFGADA